MEQSQFDELKRDIKLIKLENHVQTAAVLLFFFFGVATIYDIHKKIKHG